MDTGRGPLPIPPQPIIRPADRRSASFEGLANGSQNRFPLTWSDRKAKISKIVGWTVCEAFPRGSHAMAAAVLDFWTSDLAALTERLKKGTPGLEPTLCERPILKIGQQLIELPWMFGLQNNSTAAINNLRRLGARRGEARLETRRIEERLGNQLESRGFRVVLNWLPEDDARAGEVDLICALEQTVLVMEVKSTFMRQSQRDAWLHRTTTLRKAGQQVRDKVAAVRRALAPNDALAQKLGIRGASDPLTSLTMHGWIVDTSIECDHQRFSGFLKVSLGEVLIALRDDHYLLNDPEGIFSGRFLEPGFAPPENPRQQATLYPSGFSASQFIRVIEQGVCGVSKTCGDRPNNQPNRKRSITSLAFDLALRARCEFSNRIAYPVPASELRTSTIRCSRARVAATYFSNR
ncbi:MAG: hypothetical protein IPK63_23375 [Candidatus Competibacteraceae bacterium]|nr:hypothetical protein [Candidatus Competibacteraceae bacterium]